MKNATRILVTHQVHFAQRCDSILMLNAAGECIGCGSFAQMCSKGHTFGREELGTADDATGNDDTVIAEPALPLAGTAPTKALEPSTAPVDGKKTLASKPANLIQAEDRSSGQVHI